jgi:hypothetical protein
MNTNQLRDKFERVKQMGACVKALADQARETWIDRKRREYTRVADKLVVLNSELNLNTSAYDTMAFPVPTTTHTDTSILTNGFTDSIYEYLNLNGGAKGAMGMAENRPVYGLVTSSRSSRRMIMADPDIREDFRYSAQNEKLLAPMGVKWNYNGFTHIIDDKTNRWEYLAHASMTAAITTVAVTGGADAIMTFAITAVATALATITDAAGTTISNPPTRFYKGSQINVGAASYIITGQLSATTYSVRFATGLPVTATVTGATCKCWVSIPQYVVTGSGFTRKKVPNIGWLNATWEDSYVFHQDVCCSLVPRPITSVGPATFPAVNYSGTFRWTNYDDRDLNPDGSIGQFRGVLSSGTRPENIELGVVIRHLAVPNPDGRVMNGSSLG